MNHFSQDRRALIQLALLASWTAACDRKDPRAPASARAGSGPRAPSAENGPKKPATGPQLLAPSESEKDLEMNDTQDKESTETAVLAGGCFWGMEDILRKVPGILETEVGYAGGTTKAPTYQDVRTGTTGHAESILVVFDPKRISFAELLEKWFFRMHDPTTTNRQGNDRGTQYRSAIFYGSEEQRRTAHEVKNKVEQGGFWQAPLVTEISPLSEFTPAEGYHQDYLEKNPGGYTCHFLRGDTEIY